MTNVLLDETWYLPTFLKGNPSKGAPNECTLFLRRYRITEATSGRRRLAKKTDAQAFTSEDAMNATIRHRGWKELPAQADGDTQFVPDEVHAALTA